MPQESIAHKVIASKSINEQKLFMTSGSALIE